MIVATWWPMLGAAVAIAATVAAHFLSVARPPAAWLPTARFLPADAARAVSRAPRPRDVPLLLLRVLALAAIGAAFAGAAPSPSSEGRPTVLLVDRAVAAADTTAWRAALRRAVRDSGASLLGVLTVDSLARPVADIAWREDNALAFADTVAPIMAVSRLPAGVLAAARYERAWRLVARLDASRAAPTTLHVVSIAPQYALPEAAPAVRDAWRGAVRWDASVERRADAAALDDTAPPRVFARGAPSRDDVVRAALPPAWVIDAPDRATAYLVRAASLASGDTLAARNGALVLHWADAPDVDVEGDVGARAADTLSVSAAVLVVGDAALAAPFVRWRSRDTLGAAAGWWHDGRVAVRETPLGAGCVRRVLAAPPAGDRLLGPAGMTLVAALLRPCAGGAVRVRAEDEGLMRGALGVVHDDVAARADAGDSLPGATDTTRGEATSDALPGSGAFGRDRPASPWLAPLLLLAMAALVAEFVLRRGDAMEA